MNLIGHANKYKNVSFSQFKFNEVDAALITAIYYSLFEKIIPSYKEPDEKFFLSELTDEQINIICNSLVFDKENRKVLPIMRSSLRYRDIAFMFNYSIRSDEFIEQFSAVTLWIPFVGYVVIFRGTDITTQGWKENFSMSINSVTASQLDSVEYLNMFARTYHNKPFIICGHSKGGNLALYSSLFCSNDIASNITNIYIFDGTGIANQDKIPQTRLESLLPRINQIVPKDSVVGEIFFTPNNKRFVKSKGFFMLQHILYFWKVNKSGSFKYVEHGNKLCKIRHNVINDFVNSVNQEDKYLLIDVITSAFEDEKGNCCLIAPTRCHPLRYFLHTIKKVHTKEERKRLRFIRQSIMRLYRREINKSFDKKK